MRRGAASGDSSGLTYLTDFGEAPLESRDLFTLCQHA
jgi:hypothetical protein